MKFQSKMDDVGKNSQRVTCAKRVKSIVQSVFAGIVSCQVPKFDNKKDGAGQCEGLPGKGDGKERDSEMKEQEGQNNLCELHQNKDAEASDQIQHQFHVHLQPNLLDKLSKPQEFTLRDKEHHHHVHLSSPQHFQHLDKAALSDQCHHTHVFQSKIQAHPSSMTPVEALPAHENRDSTLPSHLVPAPVLHCQEHRSRIDNAQYRTNTGVGKSSRSRHKKGKNCRAEIENQIDRVASEYRHFQILAHQAQQNQHPHATHPKTLVHYQCNHSPVVINSSDVPSSEIEKQLSRLANELQLYKQILIGHTPPPAQDGKVPHGGYVATLCVRYEEGKGCHGKSSQKELESGKDCPDNEKCIIENMTTKCGPCIHIRTVSNVDHEGIMNHQSSAALRKCIDTQNNQHAHVVLTHRNDIPCGASKEEEMKNDSSANNNKRHNLFEKHLNKLAREYKYYQQMICHRFGHQDNAADSSQQNKDRCKKLPEQPADVKVSKQPYKPEVKVNTDNVAEVNRYLDDLAREYQHCKILVNQYKEAEPTNQGGNSKDTQKDNGPPKGAVKDPNMRFYPVTPDTCEKASDKESNCTPGNGEEVSAKISDKCINKSEKKHDGIDKDVESTIAASAHLSSTHSNKDNELKSNESHKTKGNCERKNAVKPVIAVGACLNSSPSYKEKNEQKQDVKVKCGNVESNRNEDGSSTRKHCRKHHFEDPANFESKSTVRICSLS